MHYHLSGRSFFFSFILLTSPDNKSDTTKKVYIYSQEYGRDTETVSANYCGPKVVNIHIKKLCLEIGLFLTPIDHSRKYHNIP